MLIRAEGGGVTPQDGAVAAAIFRDPRGIPTTPGHMRLAATTEITPLLHLGGPVVVDLFEGAPMLELIYISPICICIFGSQICQ